MMYGVVVRRSCFLLTTVIVAAVLAAGCSSGGGGKNTQAKKNALDSSTVAELEVGTVGVESAGPDAKVSKSVQKTILAGAQGYVDTAITAPLQTGKLPPAYAALFDTGVRSTAISADKNVLTDIGVGKAGRFIEQASPVIISALADNSGKFLYFATAFHVNVAARNSRGRTIIDRDVELTYAPVGGKWTVTAYRVHTERKTDAGTTTTTATSGSTP